MPDWVPGDNKTTRPDSDGKHHRKQPKIGTNIVDRSLVVEGISQQKRDRVIVQGLDVHVNRKIPGNAQRKGPKRRGQEVAKPLPFARAHMQTEM